MAVLANAIEDAVFVFQNKAVFPGGFSFNFLKRAIIEFDLLMALCALKNMGVMAFLEPYIGGFL